MQKPVFWSQPFPNIYPMKSNYVFAPKQSRLVSGSLFYFIDGQYNWLVFLKKNYMESAAPGQKK